MPTSIRSYSKINLGLAIGVPRPDGFHALSTLYQTLALHDVVTVEAARETTPAARSSIRLTSNHPKVPVDSGNTAWRMAERVLAALGVSAKIKIHIEKRLPIQGGLGAGSANAAAVLLALERELGAQLPPPERLLLAAQVGSDVPLFLIGGSVLGLGRGEEVYPLPERPSMPSMPCVLALPEVGVSTPEAYRRWDELLALTGRSPSSTINELSRSIAAAFGEPCSSGVFCESSERSEREDLAENPLLALVRTGIENDFEQVVFRQYPFLGEIKRVLLGECGVGERAVYAALSGSGSALFGLYRTAEGARAALERLEACGVPGLLTSTLPREEYWRGMWIP